MKKPYIQRSANVGAKSPYNPKPNLQAPTARKPAIQPDPKADAKESLSAAPATSTPDPAPKAPGGDDDLMSKPMSNPAKAS